jgi:hypothetical protein
MTLRQRAQRLAQPLALMLALGLIVLAAAARADEPKLDTESYLIPSADPGIQLYIRNKHPAGITSFAADKILLYVHGATYPSETSLTTRSAGSCCMRRHGFSRRARSSAAAKARLAPTAR